MTEPYVVWLDEARPDAVALVGGKVAGLADMVRAGFAVPPGFAVTTAAFRRFIAERGLAEIVSGACSIPAGDLSALQDGSRRISEAIEQAELPEDVEAAIRDGYVRLAGDALAEDPPVAVRSSGIAEDLQGASFAGQYETYLWILGVDEVLRHVRRCWTGLFNPRVLTYHVGGDVTSRLPTMAVAVQQMVSARAAGVMFSLDPVNGDRSKVVIEAAWGLGESVVAGEVSPDRFRVDKVTLDLLAREISTKEIEYGFDRVKRTVEVRAVPDERKASSTLTDDQVIELAKLAKQIERHRGAPMDIEWALDDDGRIHVLQVRSETVWSQKHKAPIMPAGGSAVQLVLARFMAGVGSPSSPTEEDRK